MRPVSQYGWPNCYRMSNGVVDLLVTADVGPRVTHFGFTGGENEFKVFERDAGQTGGREWRPYGGHRLWYAPEDPSGNYLPDNDPVEITEIAHGLRATQPREPGTGIRKQLEIQLAPAAAAARVVHRLINESNCSIELSAWALTVVAPGGLAILPLPPRGSHPANLLPTESVSLWPYTDLSDPRWRFGRECLVLRQAQGAPQKIGLRGTLGWAAYARAGRLFVKRFTPTPDQPRADLGCAIEVFTNAEMLELETLGPLVALRPGQSTVHIEHWSLLQRVAPPATDEDVDSIKTFVARLPDPSRLWP